jgi:6-phosphofructokinase 1
MLVQLASFLLPHALGLQPPTPPPAVQEVPKLSDFYPDHARHRSPLYDRVGRELPEEAFIGADDLVIARPFITPSSTDCASGDAFVRAGPTRTVFFDAPSTTAAIVNCGGLCPGLNTVIRELTMCLVQQYGVRSVKGILSGYAGFLSPDSSVVELTPQSVDQIHRQGGTVTMRR